MTHHQSHAMESQTGGQFAQQGGGQQRGSMQGQQQGGMQGGHQHGGQQGGMQGATMSNTLPDYQWNALTNVAQAVAICEYCKSQCTMEADPMMIECIRLCEDVAELGKTALSLVPQESRYQDQVVQAFEQAVQACAQECGQHEHAHCQQCAQVLTQTMDATSQLRQGGQGMESGQSQFGQGGMGQSQSGGFQQSEQFGGQQSGGSQYGQETFGQSH